MQFSNLLIEHTDGVSTIILNRPDVRNAIDKQTWRELGEAVKMLRDDDQTIVVIITGAGDKTFAAGADIKWLNERSAVDVLGYSGQDVLLELENLQKPILAAVNGWALGGGCELAMACDIRIASNNAKFGQPEVNLGLLPGAGGTQRLIRLVGFGRAKELIMTGRTIDADEAFTIGLVNKVVSLDNLMPEVLATARAIMNKGPLAVRMAKMAVNIAASTDLNTGLAYEKLAQAFLFSTSDRKEGTRAFLEKRSPCFRGE